MILYHYTSRDVLPAILRDGLKPGAAVDQGERLPFILFDRRQYCPNGPGGLVFLEVEVDDGDQRARAVNDFWIEYSGEIPAEQIRRVCVPPLNNREVIDLYRAGGDAAVDAAFEYVPRGEL